MRPSNDKFMVWHLYASIFQLNDLPESQSENVWMENTRRDCWRKGNAACKLLALARVLSEHRIIANNEIKQIDTSTHLPGNAHKRRYPCCYQQNRPIFSRCTAVGQLIQIECSQEPLHLHFFESSEVHQCNPNLSIFQCKMEGWTQHFVKCVVQKKTENQPPPIISCLHSPRTHQNHNLLGNAHRRRRPCCYRRSRQGESPATVQRTWTKCTREQARRLPVGGRQGLGLGLGQAICISDAI